MRLSTKINLSISFNASIIKKLKRASEALRFSCYEVEIHRKNQGSLAKNGARITGIFSDKSLDPWV